MIERLVFSGFGGQGVLTLGQIVAQIVMKSGKEVTWMPSYGPEMRGGTANCAVVISDHEIGSPIVTSNISILVAMNKPSIDKFINRVGNGGTIILNSSMITDDILLDGVNVLRVDATKIATELGNLKIQNMVMLGAFMNVFNAFTIEDVEVVLKEKFQEKNSKLISLNIEAIKKGISSKN